MLDNAENKYLELLKKDKNILRFVVEKLFTFGELSRSLDNVDSSTGNINCPFHPSEGLGNNKSQSAKVYYDEEKNIHTIHCFTKKKTYSSYDYIEKVMEEDPYKYLIKYKEISEIIQITEIIEKGYVEVNSKILEKRINFVDNTFSECGGNIIDYIEQLYVIEDSEEELDD